MYVYLQVSRMLLDEKGTEDVLKISDILENLTGSNELIIITSLHSLHIIQSAPNTKTFYTFLETHTKHKYMYLKAILGLPVSE